MFSSKRSYATMYLWFLGSMRIVAMRSSLVSWKRFSAMGTDTGKSAACNVLGWARPYFVMKVLYAMRSRGSAS